MVRSVPDLTITTELQVGDITEIYHFADWLDTLPHPIKIVIPGMRSCCVTRPDIELPLCICTVFGDADTPTQAAACDFSKLVVREASPSTVCNSTTIYSTRVILQ